MMSDAKHANGSMVNATGSITMVGLGRLGGPIAASFAARGFDVVGVDTNDERVRGLNAIDIDTIEPRFVEMLQLAGERFEATTHIDRAVERSSTTFVLVPTPSEPDGRYSLDAIHEVCHAMGPALRRKQGFHLIVIVSTVMPGDCCGSIIPLLEKTTSKTCGVDFGVCYSPEFVAIGSVVSNFLNPDFLLIGESDEYSGGLLQAIYSRVCENAPRFARMNITNAELSKIAVNSFVTMKITYANMLSEVCESLPGGDIDVVTEALGYDSRIGRKYLSGGVAFGGPCFPRDNAALAAVAEAAGANCHLPRVVDQVNEYQTDRLANMVERAARPTDTIAVLGLSYKPGSDICEPSQGTSLVRLLAQRGYRVIACDPAARMAEVNDMSIEYRPSASDALTSASIAVLTTPWPCFTDNLKIYQNATQLRVIIDPWRALNHAELPANVEYIAGGVNKDGSERRESQARCSAVPAANGQA